MKNRHQEHQEARKVDRTPSLWPNRLANIEGACHNRPNIKPNLSNPYPEGMIVRTPKRHKNLSQLIVDIMIAHQNQSMKRCKSQSKQTYIFVDRERGRCARPVS